MFTPILPESAPFSPEQRQWLNGFMAGLQNLNLQQSIVNGASPQNGNQGNPSFTESSGMQTAATPILILYGSQSGNAEGLAHTLCDRLKSHAHKNAWNPRVVGMEEYSTVDWKNERYVLMACSTWGDGDMPDNAVSFFEYLISDSATKFPDISFSVFGLGDKSYRKFCAAGRRFDERFAELGATRLLDFVECDTDYENNFQNWVASVFSKLSLVTNAQGESTPNSTQALNSPKNTLSSESKSESTYSRKNPYPAPLLENHPLNARGSAKDTRHFSLGLHGSGIQYRAGDALGIFPNNCFDLVDRLILIMNSLGSECIRLASGEETSLRSALLSHCDLRRAPEALLHALFESASHQGDKIRLQEVLEGPEDSRRAFLEQGDLLDIISSFPRIRLDPQSVIAHLGKIAPRLYSIASSPFEKSGEVHLCVGVQRTEHLNRLRKGVASTFLAERVPLGMTVPVFVQPNAHFHPPDEPGKPIIMVGPGTGIAPFRAFLQDRRHRGDPGKNWLFFGDQKRSFDFLYAEECVAMEEDGFLTKLSLAFSRDQDEKIYVQNRMEESAGELFRWLEEGAYFYVCGDAKRMAKDVDTALHKVIEIAGKKSAEGAKIYVDDLKRSKRYVRDVY